MFSGELVVFLSVLGLVKNTLCSELKYKFVYKLIVFILALHE